MQTVVLTVLILVCALPASAADFIRVTASCPGVDARTLDETVLSPMFREINGVEGLTRIETEARNDGSGAVSVYFDPKADLDLAEVRVQNRVNLALPAIPDSYRKLGISVQKRLAGPPQFWLALTSENSDHNEDFLNRYAILSLRPDCTRVLGVTDVRVVGGGDFGIQVWLNPNRLAAHKLTDRDVIDSLRRQNLQTAASGSISGRQSDYTVVASGHLTNTDAFESVTLRASVDGEVLRLKDVARVRMDSPRRGFARVDGRPAALIEVAAWPGRVTVDQLLNSDVVDELPSGMSFISLADRSTDHLLSVEIRLPDEATLERTEAFVAKTMELIRGLSGEASVFAFAEDRQPNSAMIFVRARAKGGPTAADVDKALAGISGARIRIGDVPPREAAFPVRLALIDSTEFRDPGERGEERFREAAERVLATLVRDKDVAAPAAFPLSRVPQHTIDVDRDMCVQLGVELNDLFTTLQTSLGGVHATDLFKFARVFQVSVQTDPEIVQSPEDLTTLTVRGAGDEMVPLGKLIKIQESTGPSAVVRINGFRSIVITAAPTSGKSSAQTAAKCVKLAQKVLPPGYRAIELTGP